MGVYVQPFTPRGCTHDLLLLQVVYFLANNKMMLSKLRLDAISWHM